MTTSLTTVVEGANPDLNPGLEQLQSHATLEPGCFWRVKNDVTLVDSKSTRFTQTNTFRAGDIHLLLSLFVFDGSLQSVTVLAHPKYGYLNEVIIPVGEFMANFEPATEAEAEAQRIALQSEIMADVQDIQTEMAQATANPLALEQVRQAAEAAVSQFEAKEQARAMAEAKSVQERQQDIRRIHRRAARRSQANGNPLAVRVIAVSDSVSAMVSEGITVEGTRELAIEAGRRIAIATAASTWLQNRARDIDQTLRRLTPFFEEKGRVALAKSSEAIAYVETLSKGIASLKLYTGEGVTVVTVREGRDADSNARLALLQGKRFMDEELALWAHVEDSFDWTSQSMFFERLATDTNLLNQVLPLPRCVCTMAVTRRSIDYGPDMHWRDVLQNLIENKRVFLLVRNGENVHAVYSTEPSHEAAARLFPTSSDLSAPFMGVDGTRIGLKDVAFNKSAKVFDDIQLCYKRFLILLAGLDHRERLFGSFYPQENVLDFMSLEFQQRYFQFVADEEPHNLLQQTEIESVQKWMMRMNASLASGSRVVVAGGDDLHTACRATARRSVKNFSIDKARFPATGVFCAKSSKIGHYIEVPFLDFETGKRSLSKAFLNGENAPAVQHVWFLCIDLVELADIQRYLRSRLHRSQSIAWIRTLRKVEAVLQQDLAQESTLREYLAQTALEARVHDQSTVHAAIHAAIATWRADHNGAPAPAREETAEVHRILSLMYPTTDLAQSSAQMVNDFVQTTLCEPLKLTKTADDRWVLYVTATPEDRLPYGQGVHWGWVKRILLTVRNGKFKAASSSLVWLVAGLVDATENEIRSWPALANWLNASAEKCSLTKLKQAKKRIAETLELGELLKEGRFQKRNLPLPSYLMVEIEDHLLRMSEKKYHTTTFIAILLGTYQINTQSPVEFVYAKCTALSFVARYGNDADRELAEEVRHSSRSAAAELNAPVTWSIVSSHSLVNPACSLDEADFNIPNWCSVESHKKGGIKRRDLKWNRQQTTTVAQRREKGGMPSHSTVVVNLSFNRAIDSLMGISVHRRKEFYEEQKRRLRFGYGPDKSKERYIPFKPNSIELCDIVWNPIAERSLANNYFYRDAVAVQCKS